MGTNIYRFHVGILNCAAVSDGTHTYGPPIFPPPAVFLFANAPREYLERTLIEHDLRPDKWAEWVSPYICLLVEAHNHRLLVDTGAGSLTPSTGKLIQNLQSIGIAPTGIDTIIITHAHPDHINGCTDNEGRFAFPNAKYVMWQDEWDFWTSDKAVTKIEEHARGMLVGCARKNLKAIRSRLHLIDRETEILPGIKAITTPGHTPGHMALSISSNNEQLFVISDVVLHPIHMEQPDWHAAVDLNPEQLETSRRQLFKRAVAENAMVLCFHLPFPGLGHVAQRGDAWRWQPIETLSYKG